MTTPPAGTWGYHGDSPVTLAERWLGTAPADRAEAMRHVVRHYLAAFGPASVDDLCFWASLRKRDVAAVLDDARPAPLPRREGPRAPRSAARPLPSPDTPAPARFLLRWDNLYLGHASGERDRIVPPGLRRHVYTVNTVMPATFLVDGFVAGTWRHERGRIVLEPWRRLAKAERAELADEAGRLAAFMA